MSAHNPDKDEFDPALEEGAENLGYEEESFQEGEPYAEENFAEESFADDEFGDEDPDAQTWDENFDEAAAAPPAKKKGGLFNVVLIAAAVLGGGGLIYLKVLAPKNPAPPQAVQTADSQMLDAQQQAALVTQSAPAVNPPIDNMPAGDMPLTPAPEAAPQEPAPEVAANAQGALPTLGEPAPQPATPPALALTPEPVLTETLAAPIETPAVTPVETPVVAAPVEPAAPVVEQPMEVTSAPPMPAPIATPEAAAQGATGFNAGLPSARDIMIAPAPAATATTTAPAADQAATPEQAPPAAAISADAAKSIEQKLSVLITRLDTFEGRIANLESGLHQVSGKISTLEAKPAASSDLTGVNNAIKALEDKMGALEKTSKAKAAAPAEEPVTPPASPVADAQAPADVSKIDKPTFVPAEPQDAAAALEAPKEESAPKTAPKTTAPEPARATGWILRSAQPGTAMVVAKSGGEMRTVRVGETLTGLGRITAIEQRGSKWVVQGTQGTLTH